MRQMQSLCCGFVLLLSASLWAQAQQTSQSHVSDSSQSDLANALAHLAVRSRTPLLAELAQPLPRVALRPDAPLNKDTLDELVKQAPTCKWTMEGSVVHFYDKKLKTAENNLLNLHFRTFTMPRNVSDLKLWLPGRAVGLLQGIDAEGGAISGFPDSALANDNLQQISLRDISPLQVLLHAAKQSPSFYTIIVFPSDRPTKSQAERQVSWYWGSLRAPAAAIYVQPPR